MIVRSKDARSLGPAWVVLSVVLYAIFFQDLRSFAGDAVGVLSVIPVLLAGRFLTRRLTWMVVGLSSVLIALLFNLGTSPVGPSQSWQGALLGIFTLVVTADLTGRLRDAHIRLEEASDSKDRFVASVSHELRTPLTAVVGYSSVLSDSWRQMEGIEVDTLVDLIHQQSTEVAAIVDDLLVASRLETGDLSFVSEPVMVGEEIGRVLASLPAPARSTTRVEEETDVPAQGDSRRIRQIVRNLVSNAYRHGGPNVTIRTDATKAAVVLEVVDDGPGLSAEDRETIFDPYHTSHRREGLPDTVGLGLTVSRQLARAMGGGLECTSDDRGNVFVLTIPSADRRAMRTAGAIPAGGNHHRKGSLLSPSP